MPPRRTTSWLNSFRVAIRGFLEGVTEQRNLRIHLCFTIAVIGVAAFLGISRGEWMLLVLCIGLVLTTELINTSIETVVDLVSPDDHDLARKAKDISAAAVLTVSMMAAVVGLIVLLPPLWSVFISKMIP